MGQAVGTAAAIAIRHDLLPVGIKDKMHELQQTRLKDDAYLPWVKQASSYLTINSRLEVSVNVNARTDNPEAIRDGTNRPVGEDPHCWVTQPGDWIAYHFLSEIKVETITLVLDSCA